MNDLTPIIGAGVTLLGSALTIVVFPILRNWLQAKLSAEQWNNLMAWSDLAVLAAESLAEKGTIEDKLTYACNQVLTKCASRGYTFDTNTVLEAIQGQWQALTARDMINITQKEAH